MKKLGSLPFECRFYYQGKKWTQFMRPKKPINKNFTILCYNKPDENSIPLSSDINVKPIIRHDFN